MCSCIVKWTAVLRRGLLFKPTLLPKKVLCSINTFSSSSFPDDKEKESILRISTDESVRSWLQPKGQDVAIKLYNSLTKTKVPLILPEKNIIKWYMCGPTVYDEAHLGHACCYIRFDIIRRILQNIFNLDVILMMGITDIDDKIINRANQLNMDFKHLSKKFELDFMKDMTSLNILPPTIITRVTDYIPSIIGFIQELEKKGYAYATEKGSVYFDVIAYGKYGKLWHHDIIIDSKEIVDPDKRHPIDFALWKAAKPGEPFWCSPWGNGRPGWHIECSAMINDIFGARLDIHSGGIDLLYPHHENEIAQCEAYFNTGQWANYWIHSGHLHLKNDEKMSKSLHNVISIKEFLKTNSPNHLRMLCLQTPYMNHIEYSDDSLEKAVSICKKLDTFLNTADSYLKGQFNKGSFPESHFMNLLENTRTEVYKCLANNFSTHSAIEAIEHLITECNKQWQRKETSQTRSPNVVAAISVFVSKIVKSLGIDFDKEGLLENKQISSLESLTFNEVMNELVKFRGAVRNYARTKEELTDLQTAKTVLNDRKKVLLHACDDIRQQLHHQGIQLKDHGETTSWCKVEDKKSVK